MAKLTRKHVDYGAIGKQAAKSHSMERVIISNRVLQHDTDFTCYRCAANKDDTIQQAFKRVLTIVDQCRRQSGAAFVNSHLTMGMKGGRAEMATVEPYQEKRKSDPELSYRVEELRKMLAQHRTSIFAPIVNTLKEADDSIRTMQEARIAEFGVESSVTQSGDKDLWFTDGIHMRDDGTFYTVKGYGHTRYKEVGNVKPKLVGEGTSWFWHQMIMGDTADNIPGLPKIHNKTLDRYLPLKGGKSRKEGTASCGEAKAVAMLKDVTNERDALQRVFQAYVEYWGNVPKAAEMLVEQAFLLWIRRTNKLSDVISYLTEVSGYEWTFTQAQKDRLNGYLELVKETKENGNK